MNLSSSFSTTSALSIAPFHEKVPACRHGGLRALRFRHCPSGLHVDVQFYVFLDRAFDAVERRHRARPAESVSDESLVSESDELIPTPRID